MIIYSLCARFERQPDNILIGSEEKGANSTW